MKTCDYCGRENDDGTAVCGECGTPIAEHQAGSPTPAGDWNSVAVCSDGSYGVEKDLLFSYPIRSNRKSWEIVQGVQLNEFSRGKIAITENELKEERALVADLLGKETDSLPSICRFVFLPSAAVQRSQICRFIPNIARAPARKITPTLGSGIGEAEKRISSR